MILLVRASLSVPPSWPTTWRDVTVLMYQGFEGIGAYCERTEADFYYKWMKDRGLLDYVDDFAFPEDHIYGVQIDNQPADNPTIYVDRLTPENLSRVITQLSEWV
jgi:hypothetical protein